MKILQILVFSLLATGVWGQVIDTFSDGDFTSNPTWSGSTDSWRISQDSIAGPNTSNAYVLKLDVSAGSGTKYLSTQRSEAWGTEQSWGAWIGRRSNSPATSSNRSYVWLWANASDLSANTTDGYRIRLGDNSGDDEVYLERVDDGSATTVITSSVAIPNNTSDLGFLVRVTRNASSTWTLYTSTLPTANGGGYAATSIPSATNTDINQGSATDSSYTNFDNGYFGFMAKHSSDGDHRTGARFDQLYFDTASDSSLPVELSAFTAYATKDQIKLQWRTESETDNAGFWIYRSSQRNGEFKRLNPVLIRGAGTTAMVQTYTFTDNDVEDGISYFYYLEDVAFDGTRNKSLVIQASLRSDLARKHLTRWSTLKQ